MDENYDISDKPIAAIATPLGYGGISVIRISGEEAFAVVNNLLEKNEIIIDKKQQGTFFHTAIYDSDSRKCIDDVLILVFKAPKSYTGENTVEIQGHGGLITAQRLLNAVLNAGARLAEPGEFTKRAFLNGRLDLTQAEAVCDLIHSQTERAAETARAQLDGLLGNSIKDMYDEMVDISSGLEHVLDFDEGELADKFVENTKSKILNLKNSVEKMIATWREGELLRQGVMVVLSGPPNAGKSSLLNRFLKRNRAIVHNTPGTTRDVIEESYSLKGVPVRLVDTAGLRDTANDVETEGIKRACALIDQADMNLLVVDNSSVTTEAVKDLLEIFDKNKLIIVLNKCDIAGDREVNIDKNIPVVSISALTGEGLDHLKDVLSDMLGIKDELYTQAVITQRHLEELKFADDSLDDALSAFEPGIGDIVVAAGYLREGSEALGRITGRTYSEDLLDNIFSNFCIGK